MQSELFTKGAKRLSEVVGLPEKEAVESLKTIALDVDKYIVEFCFAEIYSRDGLSLQEREIITLTSLVTQGGCDSQMEFHIKASLNVGISAEKIIEIFIHCIPYAGFPRVRNAVKIAGKVFSEKNIILSN